MIGSLQELSRKHEAAETKVIKLERDLDAKTNELNNLVQSQVKDSAHTLDHRISALERSAADAIGAVERRVEQALRDHDRAAADELVAVRTDIATIQSATTDHQRRATDSTQSLAHRLTQLESAAARLAPTADLERVAAQVDALTQKLSDMASASSTAIAATQRLQDTVAHAAAAMQTRAEQVEQAADAAIRETRARVDSAIDSLEGRTVAALTQCRDDVIAVKREAAETRRELEGEAAARNTAIAKALITARDATAAVERKGDDERARLLETIRSRFGEVAAEMDAAAKAAADALGKRCAACDDRISAMDVRMSGVEEGTKTRAARTEAALRSLTDSVGILTQDTTSATTKLAGELSALRAAHEVTTTVARKAADDAREGLTAKALVGTMMGDLEALTGDVRQTLPELRRDADAAATAAAEAATTADAARADARALRESTARELQDCREGLLSALGTKTSAHDKRLATIESALSDVSEQAAALERGAIAAEQRSLSRDDAARGMVAAVESGLRGEVAALSRHVDSELKAVDTRVETELARVEERTSDDVRGLDVRFNARIDAEGAVVRAVEGRLDEHISNMAAQVDRLTSRVTAHHAELSEEVGRVTAGVQDAIGRVEGSLREALEGQRNWTHELGEALDARVSRLATQVEQARNTRATQDARAREALEEKIAAVRATMEDQDDALAARIEERTAAIHSTMEELGRRRDIALTAATTKLSDRLTEKMDLEVKQLRAEQTNALEGTAGAFKGQEALLERLRAQVREVAAAQATIEGLRLKDRPWEALVESLARSIKQTDGRLAETTATAAEVPALKETLERVGAQVRELVTANAALEPLRLKDRPWDAVADAAGRATKALEAKVGDVAAAVAEVPPLQEALERVTQQVRELAVGHASLEVLRLRDRPWEAGIDAVARAARQTELRLSELLAGQVAEALQTATGVEQRLQTTEAAISRELSQVSGAIQAAKAASEIAIEGVRGELHALATQVAVDGDRGSATCARLDVVNAQLNDVAAAQNTAALRLAERPWEPFVQGELQRVGTSAHARITAVADEIRKANEDAARVAADRQRAVEERVRALSSDVATATAAATSALTSANGAAATATQATIAANAAQQSVAQMALSSSQAAPSPAPYAPTISPLAPPQPAAHQLGMVSEVLAGRVAALETRTASLVEEVRAASASAVEALVGDSTRGAQLAQVEAAVQAVRALVHDRDKTYSAALAAAAAAAHAVPPTPPPQTVPAVRDTRDASTVPSDADGSIPRSRAADSSSPQMAAMVEALKQRLLRVESAVRAHQKLQEELPAIVGSVDVRCDDNASALARLAEEVATFAVRLNSVQNARPVVEKDRDVIAVARVAATAASGDAATRALEEEVATLSAQVAEVRATMAASGMRSREALMADVDARLDASSVDLTRRCDALHRLVDSTQPLLVQLGDMLRGDVPPEVASAVAGSPELATLVELKVRHVLDSQDDPVRGRPVDRAMNITSLEHVLTALDRIASTKGGGDASDTARAVKAALMLPTALGFPPEDVVGISTGRYTADEAIALTLATPALSTVVDRITELQEFAAAIDARVSKPGSESELAAVLGVQVVDERPHGGSVASGVRVVAIREGGPAYVAGIQVGDVIRAYNRHKVSDRVSFKAVVRRSSPDSSVEVVVLRTGSLELETLLLTPEGKDAFPNTHYRAAFPGLRGPSTGSTATSALRPRGSSAGPAGSRVR